MMTLKHMSNVLVDYLDVIKILRMRTLEVLDYIRLD